MEELDKSQHAPSATAAAVPEMHTPSSTHTMRYVEHDTLIDSRGLSLLHTPPASQPSSQGNSQLIHHYQPALTLKATPQQDDDSSSPPAPAAVQVNTTKPRTSSASSGSSLHTTKETHSGSTSPMIDTKLHNNNNNVMEKKRLADSLDSVNVDSLDDTPPRVAATRTNRTQHTQASHETLDVRNKESCEGTNTMACPTTPITTTTPFVESSDDGEESSAKDKSDEHITQEEDVVQPRSPEPREGSNTTVLTSHTLTPHTTRTTTTAAASTTHLCLSETLLPQSHPQTPSPLRKSHEQTTNGTTENEKKKEEEYPLRRELLFIDNADGTAYLADAALQGDGSYTLGQTILLAQRPDSMLQYNHKSNTVGGQKHAYDMAASPLPRAPCTESLSRALNMDAEEDMVPLTQLRSNTTSNTAQGGFTEADESPLAIRPPWASTSSFSPSVSLMHVARVVRPTNTTNSGSERSAAPARSDTEYPATPLFLSSTTLDVQTTLKKKKEKETPIEEEEEERKGLQETGPRRERAVSRRSNSPAALHDFAFDQTILLCPIVPTSNSNSNAPSINVPMSAQFQHYNKATREECPSPAIVIVPPGGALPQSDVHRTNNAACENDTSLLQADQTAVFTDSTHANNNNFDEANADVTLLMNSFADSVRILPPSAQPFMSGSSTAPTTTTTAGADTLNNDMTRVPRAALRPTALTPQQIAAQGWIPVQVYNPHTMPDFAPSAEDILHATSMPSAGRHAASPLPLDPLSHNNDIDATTTDQYDTNFSPLPTCTTPHHTSVTSSDQGWREGSPSRPNSRSLMHQYNNRRHGNNISAGAAIRTATPLDATTLATISRRLSFSTQSGWGSPTLSNASMTLSRQGSFIDPSTAVGSPYGLQSHNGSFSMSRATSLYGSPATAHAACGPMNAHHSASDWAGQTVMQWQTQSQKSCVDKIPLYVDARRQVDTASPLPLNPQSPSPEPREGSPSRCTTESNTPMPFAQTVMREAGKTSTHCEAEKHVTTRTEETQTDITTGEENTMHETPRETQSAMSDASSRVLQWSDLLTSMSFQRSVALTATLMEYSSALTGTSLSLPLTTTSQPSSASVSLQLHRPTTRLSDMQYFFKPHNNNNGVTNITTTTTTTTTKVTMPRQAAPGRGSVGDVTSYASSILSSVTTQSEQLPRTGGAVQRAAGQDRTTTTNTGVTSGTNFACKRPPALRRMRGLPITRGSLHASLHGGLAENGTSRGHRGIHDVTRNSTRLQTAYVDPIHMPATANISHKQGPMASGTTQYNKQQGPMHVTSHANVAGKLMPDTSVFLPFSPLTITPESSYNMPSNPVCEDNSTEETNTTAATAETRRSNNAQDNICRILPLETVTNAENTINEDSQRDVDERITVKSQPAALHIVSQPQLPVTPSDMELDTTLSSTLNNRLTTAGVSPIGRPSVCLPALRERTSANIDECNLSKAAAEQRHSSTQLGLNSTPHDVTI